MRTGWLRLHARPCLAEVSTPLPSPNIQSLITCQHRVIERFVRLPRILEIGTGQLNMDETVQTSVGAQDCSHRCGEMTGYGTH